MYIQLRTLLSISISIDCSNLELKRVLNAIYVKWKKIAMLICYKNIEKVKIFGMLSEMDSSIGYSKFLSYL